MNEDCSSPSVKQLIASQDANWSPMVWRNAKVKAKIVYWPHENYYSLIVDEQKLGPFKDLDSALAEFNAFRP